MQGTGELSLKGTYVKGFKPRRNLAQSLKDLNN
jgi:hypothetical protein